MSEGRLRATVAPDRPGEFGHNTLRPGPDGEYSETNSSSSNGLESLREMTAAIAAGARPAICETACRAARFNSGNPPPRTDGAWPVISRWSSSTYRAGRRGAVNGGRWRALKAIKRGRKPNPKTEILTIQTALCPACSNRRSRFPERPLTMPESSVTISGIRNDYWH